MWMQQATFPTLRTGNMYHQFWNNIWNPATRNYITEGWWFQQLVLFKKLKITNSTQKVPRHHFHHGEAVESHGMGWLFNFWKSSPQFSEIKNFTHPAALKCFLMMKGIPRGLRVVLSLGTDRKNRFLKIIIS